ncbi:MAG: hypothetical protein KF729_30605 [Sandaracinaceae bacterium]|nr:hypothetical protein [Sandaracinaceae bacterium]
MKTSESHEPSCPVPFSAYERVTLAHGGGGRVMHRLIEGLFRRAFASPELDLAHDGARVARPSRWDPGGAILRSPF